MMNRFGPVSEFKSLATRDENWLVELRSRRLKFGLMPAPSKARAERKLAAVGSKSSNRSKGKKPSAATLARLMTLEPELRAAMAETLGIVL